MKKTVDDEIMKSVKEVKRITQEDLYKNDSVKDLKKDFPNEIDKIEELYLNIILKRTWIFWKWIFLINGCI